MPKYYCDYCDTFLTHDSPSVRKTHNGGRKHKENVRMYYQSWMEQQAQKLVDATARAFTAQQRLGPRPAVGMPAPAPGFPYPLMPPTLPTGIPRPPLAMPGMPPISSVPYPSMPAGLPFPGGVAPPMPQGIPYPTEPQ